MATVLRAGYAYWFLLITLRFIGRRGPAGAGGR